MENLDWLDCCETDFIATLNVANNRIRDVRGLENGKEIGKTRFNVMSEIDLSGNGLKEFVVKNVRFPSLDTLSLAKNEITKFP